MQVLTENSLCLLATKQEAAIQFICTLCFYYSVL